MFLLLCLQYFTAFVLFLHTLVYRSIFLLCAICECEMLILRTNIIIFCFCCHNIFNQEMNASAANIPHTQTHNMVHLIHFHHSMIISCLQFGFLETNYYSPTVKNRSLLIMLLSVAVWRLSCCIMKGGDNVYVQMFHVLTLKRGLYLEFVSKYTELEFEFFFFPQMPRAILLCHLGCYNP